MSWVTITRVGSLPQCVLGEGPHWDQETQSLLYVDIVKCCLFRFYPESGRLQRMQLEPSSSGTNVTFVLPVEGEPDLFLISVGLDVGLVRWRSTDADQLTSKVCSLVSVDQDKPRNRFNDGKCDPKRQLWAGTMGYESEPGITEREQGKLYCFSSDLKPKQRVENIDLSNGLAWSADKTKFYYIDTGALSVDAFDYDEKTDSINKRRKLVDYKAVALNEDFPDGMTIDTDGNLWVANYNGAKLLQINGTEGGIMRTVGLPFQNPTSVCWAGPNYDYLFVTSSRMGLTKEQLDKAPDNGGIFKISGLRAKGTPPNKVKLDRALIDKMK